VALPGARRRALLPVPRREGLTITLRSTADRWLRIKAITADALEHPVAERPSFLTRACGGDETLQTEVESLLAADAGAGAFLEVSGLADPDAARAIVSAAEQGIRPTVVGQRIGPYRVIAELGRGGMGVVYLAERADAAYEKQVAIKVVRGGFAAEPLMQRFQEERRILATLDHPNIARLLDAGTTADGLPYFVMEHVNGIPLDDYARAPLSLRERLVLFHQVCAAVQYAHQRLVIHRDLKARNILVTPDGTPKLLDFGIAKLLEPGLEDEQTRTGLRALSLDGASPEQVRGEPLTVTSDVYALGVLLYRLLTGQGPYGPSRRTDADLVRAICEDSPERPSAVAPVEHRRELRRELDWVTLEALRKEPDRRYASVQQLGDDIQRYLEGRPVTAAPDSWRYRTGKFVTRNRTAVAIGALLAVSLAAGLTATLWQARRAENQRARAERRFDDVRQLANSFLFEHDKAIADLPGSTPARELLVRRALQYLDGLSQEARGDRSLRRELAEAYQKVGDVQGNPFRASLGDSAGALASYGKARTILAALAAEDPADVRTRRDLAHCYAAIGDLEWTAGDGTAAAVRNYREALALREAISAADPTNVEARLELAKSHHSLGTMTAEMADQLKAVELSEALFADDPLNRQVRTLLAASHESLGSGLASRGDTARALEVQAKALQVRRALLAEDPSNTTFMRLVAASCFQMGSVLEKTGDTAGALEKYREMLAIYQKLTVADPTDAQARAAQATPYNMIGRVLVTREEVPGALKSYREAFAIGERALAADAKNAQVRYSLAVSRRGLGDVYAMLASQPQVAADTRARHWREARGWFQQSRDDLSDMKARGLLNHPESMSVLDDIIGQVARCDRALAEGK
jgi:non-specific serine/threonine protein kinase/serine/threonine-protein kinase